MSGILLRLPNEIWLEIFKFLFFIDIFNFKFLSKRLNEIYFLNNEVNFLNRYSKNLFDTVNYYDKFQYYFIQKLNKKFKKNFDFCTYLFLKYSLEEIANETTISNFLLHLFYCPRSIFAKNTCLRCSRIFIKKDLKKSSDFVNDFKFVSCFDIDKLDIELQDIAREFEFNIFFKNKDQLEVINSDRKRCLDSFVVQEHIHFLLLFSEIQLRIFVNFFYCLSDFLPNRREREKFLDYSFEFIKKFVLYSIDNINFDFFSTMFDEIEYDQFKFLKVINKKYIETVKEKYAD